MLDWQLLKRAESQAQQIGSYKGEDVSHDMNARPVLENGRQETPSTDKPTGDNPGHEGMAAMQGQASTQATKNASDVKTLKLNILGKTPQWSVRRPPKGTGLKVLKKMLTNKHDWKMTGYQGGGAALGTALGLLGGPAAPITAPLGAAAGMGVGSYLGYRDLKGAGRKQRQQLQQRKDQGEQLSEEDEANLTVLDDLEQPVPDDMKAELAAKTASLFKEASAHDLIKFASVMEDIHERHKAVTTVQRTREEMRENQRRLKRLRKRRKEAEDSKATGGVERPGGMSMGSALKAPSVTQSVPQTPSQKVLNTQKMTAPALPIDSHSKNRYTSAMRFNTLTNQNF